LKQFVTEFTSLDYLSLALNEAKLRRGYCAPNPSVGALLVKEGEILAAGKHWQAGHPHAEVDVLNQVSQEQSRGATLYVTLEPCCHFGRTPPCTKLIIEREISRVIYAYADPHPLVAGKGQSELVSAGIACEHFPLPEIDEFYRSYRYWQKYQRPWVTAKLALSLDGKIAAANGSPLEITGPECRRLTHEFRNNSDAILTTATTVLADNPALNVRLEENVAKPIYVLDAHLELSGNEKIFSTAARLTLFHGKNFSEKKRENLLEKGVFCIFIEENEEGLLSLTQILDALGKEGVHDLWVEAGGKLFYEFYSQGLMHRALIYVAPKTLGPEAKSAFLDAFDITQSAASSKMMACGGDVVWDMIFGS
jgi:diaminohydroxyphosphoribosylaminopyrimidine deaminase/5-amino-6-(5-phosphoribosylamino)uracil reductase